MPEELKKLTKEVKKTEKATIHEKLVYIQKALKAPKNQWNSFGKYKYRSCEDILEGLKPHLTFLGMTITIQDEIVMVGERFYVKATITLADGEAICTSVAYAREEESKKGMDSSQVTGAASSYARKYALNGLLAIDDTKDSDKTSDAKQAVDVPQALVEQIDHAANLADLTALCKNATTGKSEAYKKSVLVYYNMKKEKLGGEI
jgi:hypothetical protein